MTIKQVAWNRCRWGALLLVTLAAGMTGCEVDSFMDPSVVGRWERTPVTLPILDRLDVIDEPGASNLEITSVRPADLIPDVREYVIGSGDLVTVTVFELVMPGQESIQTRRVDETGMIRLPVVGNVQAAGLSPSELEQSIRSELERQGVLRDAMVSVILQEARQNTYSVIGEPEEGGTAIGTYAIPQPNFRLLEALALARGVPGRTKNLLIYRQTELTKQAAGKLDAAMSAQTEEAPAPATEDPSKLIEQLMQGVEDQPQAEPTEAQEPEAAPAGMESGLEADSAASRWVNVDGKWVRVEQRGEAAVAAEAAAKADIEARLGELISQRIIEVPYDRLLEGDMRYNIVIRPGDVIRVPAQDAGFVYIMGAINRPGAYVVPGENELTLKQLVASAGNLSQLAIPERVDLVRRVGGNLEATVRLNVRAIFDGTEPDVFLKPNDLVNVGTNFFATPLAIIRNGFRTTYGFGFILDRNFGTDVFGAVDSN